MSMHATAVPADVSRFEDVACYLCGDTEAEPFMTAQDDLTGRPGRFSFVTCRGCGLRYQNPRLRMEHILEFYDDDYIAHRKRSSWGLLTRFFNRAMERHDREKDRLVRRYVRLGEASEVLDVGCAVGTYLEHTRRQYGSRVAGVDFKDLSGHPSLRHVEFHCGLFYEQPLAAERFDLITMWHFLEHLRHVEFHCGLFYEQPLAAERFDLITMWHFLEHDYDPAASLRAAYATLKPGGTLIVEVPRLDSVTFRAYGNRWPGLQAPQHTVLYDRERLLRMVERAGFETVDHLPYGAFPAFFYIFTGAAFKLLRGRGLDQRKAIYPYFVAQLLFTPVLLLEKRLNLAMQTVVCRRPS